MSGLSKVLALSKEVLGLSRGVPMAFSEKADAVVEAAWLASLAYFAYNTAPLYYEAFKLKFQLHRLTQEQKRQAFRPKST
ncbi:hypothetical protein RchiOBHm_Chr5g0009161 [Rosa chinensis]|uniref:Uncharacterized protein n=1 Tax=Rosa chinensis TaxID=74649 RepID=A0A2P6Q495_ROSCH|nr:hypothetical protein RchiOBHm_Chr5g0009161 [Rosa chinensis]